MSKIAAKWINTDANTLTSSGSALAVNLATSGNGGALEGTVNGINIRVSGITNAMLAGSIDLGKLAKSVIAADGTNAFTANQSVGGFKLTHLANGTDATDAINLSQLEAALSGLDFQPDIIAVVDPTTSHPGDGTLAAAAAGQRYIVSSDASEQTGWGTITGCGSNDIVAYDGTTWAVAYDVSAKGAGALAWDTTTAVFMRWDGTVWSEFGGLAGITAGIGLSKTGNTINLDISETTPGLTTTNGLAVLIDAIGGSGLAKAVNVSANGLAVKVDDTTITGDATTGALKVKDSSIGASQVKLTDSFDFSSGSVSVPTATSSDSSTKAASTAFVAGAVSTLSSDVPSSTNYTPTAATIKGHLQGISSALGNVAVQAQETILITASTVSNGYFELATPTNNLESVVLQPTTGPRQINALVVGTSGATPDFTVVNTTEPVVSRVHINNNGGQTGLSGLIGEGDVVIVNYTHASL